MMKQTYAEPPKILNGEKLLFDCQRGLHRSINFQLNQYSTLTQKGERKEMLTRKISALIHSKLF